MELAVKVTWATPLPSVITGLLLVKVPLGPLAGFVKVTSTPLIGVTPDSETVACKGFAKAVPLIVLWGVPPVAVIL